MNKKNTRILISILHICIFSICILTIYSKQNSAITVAHITSDTLISTSDESTVAEPEIEIKETEPEETEIESEIEVNTQPEAETESEISTVSGTVTYKFKYIGTHLNLNIRKAPSISASIIGKVPVGGRGDVLEITNDEWALITYKGQTGYCNMKWLALE